MKIVNTKLIKDILEYVEHRRVTNRCIHFALGNIYSSESYISILDNTVAKLVLSNHINEERKHFCVNDIEGYVPFYTITDKGVEHLST